MPKNQSLFYHDYIKVCWQMVAVIGCLVCGAADAQTAPDADAAVIKNVHDLYYQTYQPPTQPATLDASTPNLNRAVNPSYGTARSADDDSIKNNVLKLYSQGEKKTVNPIPYMPPSAAPTGNGRQAVINTAPVDQLSPSASVTSPASSVVADKVATISTAPAPQQPQSAAPATMAVPVASASLAATSPAVAQVVSAEDVAPRHLDAPKTVAPVPTVLAVSPVVKPVPPSALLTQAETQKADSPIKYVPEEGGSSDFLQMVAGTDFVPLNVADSDIRATVSDSVHLEEAVAYALKNNFESLATHAKSDSAYWDKMGGYAEYFPSLQFVDDTGPERSDPASINDANGNRVLDNTHHRRDILLSIRQPLIDLGVLADIQSLGDKQDIADIEGRDAREGIAYDTISAYLDLIQARLSVQLAYQYKEYLDRLAVRMKSRVEGGAGTTADLERIRGRSTNAEAARVLAMGEYEATVAELRRLTHIVPAQIVIPKVVAPPVPEDMMAAKEAALKYNPSYLSSQKKADLAADDRNKSFSGLLPKLLLEYNSTHSFNAGGAAEGNPVDGIYPTQDTQSVMLVAEWDFGATSITSGISGIAKGREMNLHSLDVRQKLEQGIESGYAAINAARQREVALRKSVDANEKVVKGFDLQYDAGGRSLFDLLDANEQLYNAKLNLMRVTIAGAKAAYQIRRQMGQLVPSILGSEKG